MTLTGAIPFFGRMTLAAIEPRTIKEYAAHIASRGRLPNVRPLGH